MPEIDINVYFYTYSTIAQTLAGAFGFLVAVVLYLIQGINSHISDCAGALVANSPAVTFPKVAAKLRRAGTYVWFYSGSVDKLLGQNRTFERELQRLHIPSHFYVVRGGHDWALWRGQASRALVAAADALVRPGVRRAR